MARTTANVINAASASSVLLVEMVRLELSTGALYIHSGVGVIRYNGDDYTGVGEFGSISGLTESEEFRPQDINLSISGIDPALVAGMETENVQGRDVDIYIALLNPDMTIIDQPINSWSGFMDVPVTSINGNTGQILISCESRLSSFNRAKVSRYTDADQQARFPGDLAMQYVDQVPNQTLTWGGVLVRQPSRGQSPGQQESQRLLQQR